jgi:hypothetical protein
MSLHASAEQMGYAAIMRGSGEFSPGSSERNILNKVIHSRDKFTNFRRYGPNPFSSNRGWDPSVQDALVNLAKKHNMQEVVSGLESCKEVKSVLGDILALPSARCDLLRRVEGVLGSCLFM